MDYTGAELIIKFLEERNINIVAGIPGGANLPLYDALSKSRIRHILARHEQSAGFIAQGIARSTGKTAVCFATSGPGATNLLTAIADAKLDSVPIIAITGQVPTSLIGSDSFQEVDTYGMSIPITKHNFLARNVDELPKILTEAFRIANSGRPGPVLIDVPKDVQKSHIKIDPFPVEFDNDNPSTNSDEQINKLAELIHQSKKPLLYIGGGMVNSRSCKTLYGLANINKIPVVSTLMGLGSFPNNHPLFLGMLGMHGSQSTNMILNKTDLLIAIGVRFDDRATGKVVDFCPGADIVHIDIDASEIDKIKKTKISLIGHIDHILPKLLPLLRENNRESWIEEIKQIKTEYSVQPVNPTDFFSPANLIKKTAQLVPQNTIITTDVGQHQMWAAQYYPFSAPRTFLTSGGLGTMGFGIPAAIGAALAFPEKTVVSFTGDGSFLMNIQELATIVEENLNIKILLFNNGQLGLVRQQQELFYEKNYYASKFAHQPDFVAIGKGFGIKSINLGDTKNPDKALSEHLKSTGPVLIDIPIEQTENVFPIVPPGAGNLEMIGGK